MAEESGQILEIGRWALARACRDIQALEARFGDRVAVAVNVSAL